MKRIVHLLMALVLCVALTVPAMAADVANQYGSSDGWLIASQNAIGTKEFQNKWGYTCTAQVYPAGTVITLNTADHTLLEINSLYNAETNGEISGVPSHGATQITLQPGVICCVDVFDGSSFSDQIFFLTAEGGSTGSAPSAKSETKTLADGGIGNEITLTGTFTKVNDYTYDVIVEPGSTIEAPWGYSVSLYYWNGSAQELLKSNYNLSSCKASEAFVYNGRTVDMIAVGGLSGGMDYLYNVTLAGAVRDDNPAPLPTPTPVPTPTPAPAVDLVTVKGEDVTVRLYGGDVIVSCKATVTEDHTLTISEWGEARTSTGILVELKKGSSFSVKMADGQATEAGLPYYWDTENGCYALSVEALAVPGLVDGVVDAQFGTVKYDGDFEYRADMFWASADGTPVFFVLKSGAPAPTPSTQPSQAPSVEPSKEPTAEPTPQPSKEPAVEPSKEPAADPAPTTEPTTPSADPAPQPTAEDGSPVEPPVAVDPADKPESKGVSTGVVVAVVAAVVVAGGAGAAFVLKKKK